MVTFLHTGKKIIAIILGLLDFNGLDNNTVCKRNDLHSSCPPIIKYNENFFGTFGPFLLGLWLFSTPFL